MTLFVALLIIYGLDMNPWLYAVAVVVWGVTRKWIYTRYQLRTRVSQRQ